jgi:hypothetical protein
MDDLKRSMALGRDTGNCASRILADCSLLGELTDQGRLSTTMLGQRIRSLYVDQLGFLPPKLEDENTIYMRSIVP